MKQKTLIIVLVIILFIIFWFRYTYKTKRSVENNLNTKEKINTEISLKTSSQKITQQEAIELIKNREEVKEWLSLFSEPDNRSPKTGGKPIIEFDHNEDNLYIIHVYELISDHTATFNWYKVNSLNREITTRILKYYKRIS